MAEKISVRVTEETASLLKDFAAAKEIGIGEACDHLVTYATNRMAALAKYSTRKAKEAKKEAREAKAPKGKKAPKEKARDDSPPKKRAKKEPKKREPRTIKVTDGEPAALVDETPGPMVGG